MMSSRHLGQYKGKFYIIYEVLIANLSPAMYDHLEIRLETVV